MVRHVTAWVAGGAMVGLLVGSAVAQGAKKPDATLKLSEGSVGAGIGWSWGKGVLTYKGKTYPFKVEGLSVGELGITKAEATGNVYDLKKLEDFSGRGVVRLGGEIWKAQSAVPLRAGQRVRVVRIEGLMLDVEPL